MRWDRAKSQKMKKQAPPIPEGALESLNRQEIRPAPELERALAVKRAMLELTTDAILVTDEVQVTDFNEKYLNMWRVSREILENGIACEVRQLMSQNFAEPQQFLTRIDEITATAQESFDILELKDGRLVPK